MATQRQEALATTDTQIRKELSLALQRNKKDHAVEAQSLMPSASPGSVYAVRPMAQLLTAQASAPPNHPERETLSTERILGERCENTRTVKENVMA